MSPVFHFIFNLVYGPTKEPKRAKIVDQIKEAIIKCSQFVCHLILLPLLSSIYRSSATSYKGVERRAYNFSSDRKKRDVHYTIALIK